MSKKLLIACLIFTLIFALSGCRKRNQPSLDEAETQAASSSFSESKEGFGETLADDVNETSQSQAAVASTQEETTHTNNTAATHNERDRQPQQQNEETITPTNSQRTEPTSAPVPTQEEPAKPQTQPTPEPTSEPAFDIGYWTSFAKEYAQSIGLSLDSSATECWDNPITANAQRTSLRDDITGRLDRYKNIEGFTSVWIWAEKVSDTEYEIYIGYA